jgi:hypothetical protein
LKKLRKLLTTSGRITGFRTEVWTSWTRNWNRTITHAEELTESAPFNALLTSGSKVGVSVTRVFANYLKK